VRLYQRLVEDRLKSGGEQLPGARDVLGDRRRVGDNLVLVARVELHVPRLVHLLRGEERGLLLGPVGAHEPRELGGDPLLGHHQRRQRPEHERAVGGVHVPPLPDVAVERDLERAPLLVLPVAIERLGVVKVSFGGHRPRSLSIDISRFNRYR
jgi:hypothetical protein